MSKMVAPLDPFPQCAGRYLRASQLRPRSDSVSETRQAKERGGRGITAVSQVRFTTVNHPLVGLSSTGRALMIKTGQAAGVFAGTGLKPGGSQAGDSRTAVTSVRCGGQVPIQGAGGGSQDSVSH